MTLKPSLLTLVGAAFAAGCAAPPHEFDPFGRPYSAENTLLEIDLKDCVPAKTDRPAHLISGSRPLFPVGEMLAGRSGTAVLTFEVSSEGAIRAIGQDAENQWFASHAAIAMRDWKVTPAQQEGKPVTVVCRLGFTFGSLSHDEARRRGLNASVPSDPTTMPGRLFHSIGFGEG
jgi:hypothetical protein